MDDLFIGYLLDALDERDRRQVETYLAQHPETREKLRHLRQALEPLAADKDAFAPPPLLAERTLARIAEHVCAPERHGGALPQAPALTPASLAPPRSWWRRADVLVAACLLVAVVGLSLMALARMRGPSSAALLVECKNNLRQFYSALQGYRDQHGRLPDISQEEEPRKVAGIVVPMLQDAGTLPASVSIRCPGIGSPLPCQTTLASLRQMSGEDFAQESPCLSMCYAYSLGYRDEANRYHGPGDLPKGSWSQTPIMADRPPPGGILSNSVNHGGTGQNVLFADGTVKFLPQRIFGAGDDIFLNRDGNIAAGKDAGDIVLGASAARP